MSTKPSLQQIVTQHVANTRQFIVTDENRLAFSPDPDKHPYRHVDHIVVFRKEKMTGPVRHLDAPESSEECLCAREEVVKMPAVDYGDADALRVQQGSLLNRIRGLNHELDQAINAANRSRGTLKDALNSLPAGPTRDQIEDVLHDDVSAHQTKITGIQLELEGAQARYAEIGTQLVKLQREADVRAHNDAIDQRIADLQSQRK